MNITKQKLRKLIEEVIDENWGDDEMAMSAAAWKNPDHSIYQTLRNKDAARKKEKEMWAKSQQEWEDAPIANFDPETGEPLTDKGKAVCAKNPQCADKWLK